MKKILTIILSIIVAVSFNGCKATQNTEPQDDARIKIVTTLFPYYDFVRAVIKGVDGISITMTVAPGQDSHSFEPTPKDIIKIEDADLFIYNGGTLETWVDSVLGALSNDEHVMRMMDYVDVMEEETVEGMDLRYEHSHDHSEEMHSHSEESEHSHDEENEHSHDEESEQSHDEESEHSHDDKEYDEHIWTSPVNAMKMVGYICDEMIKIDPDNAEIYKANANEYIGKIQNIDTQIRKIVNKMDKKEIIFADKFPLLYFAKEYGLSYYAAFPGCAEDTEPSARTIAFLIDKINEDKINKVYYLELSSKAVANTICEDTGAKAYEFNSCHNITEKQFQSGVTYVDLMTKNLEVLKK
ncbi:metal ABC transporter substrate-binding protein [uncultured Eubacterium sp.]|uniref:metal ABC transporter substrate-binding protein n=1 Tax=uncultured Eubacterium sp. TaxID=165185 RepID=UPI0032645926